MWMWIWLACAPSVTVVDRGLPGRERALEQAWEQVQVDVEDWRVRTEVDGVAVAVIIDGRTRFAEGFGTSAGLPVDAGTVFRWASVTKPLVSTAALQLVDEGVLHLDDPLSMWLPDFHPSGPFSLEEPRIGDLLTHRSALADRLVWRCDTEDEALSDAFTGPTRVPLLAPPGAFYNYSNTGFSAMGAVLERVHGVPFRELMQAEVLDPLGLRTATFDVDEAVAWGGGPGEGGSDGETEMPLQYWDCASARPAAWLHGSVTDLARFVEQLDEGPIAPRMASARDTRYRADGGHRAGPGLFSIDYRDALEMWIHDGWVSGFTSELAWLPAERVGVVLVANHDGINLTALRSTVVDRFLGLDPTTSRHTAQVDEHGRSELVGTYTQPVSGFAPPWATGTLTIVEHDDLLWMWTADPVREPAPVLQTDGDAYVIGLDDVAHAVRFIEADGERWLVHRNWVARKEP